MPIFNLAWDLFSLAEAQSNGGTAAPLRSGRGVDEGNGLQEAFPRGKEQEGCYGGDRVEELVVRTVFLACPPCQSCSACRLMPVVLQEAL